jgi:hypothetical protein
MYAKVLVAPPKTRGLPIDELLGIIREDFETRQVGVSGPRACFNGAGFVSPYESVLVWCHRSGMTVARVFLTLLRSLSPRA